jgi:hypothetical protein
LKNAADIICKLKYIITLAYSQTVGMGIGFWDHAHSNIQMQVGIQMGVLAPPNEGKPTLDAISILKAAILNAVDVYRSPTFLQLQQNCMALDVSWSKPAAEWEKVGLSLSLHITHLHASLRQGSALFLVARFAHCMWARISLSKYR